MTIIDEINRRKADREEEERDEMVKPWKTTDAAVAGDEVAKKIRDEAARTRVLTNAATVLSIDPKELLDRAEIKEVLGEIKEVLEALRDKYAADDQRIRDEMLYAIAKNLVISPGGGEPLFAARSVFKARFLPEVGIGKKCP